MVVLVYTDFTFGQFRMGDIPVLPLEPLRPQGSGDSSRALCGLQNKDYLMVCNSWANVRA